MPTYAYRCDACSNQFEIVQRMADDPIKTCPDCVGQVRRIIHPVGVVFKGSGWYINDSRPDNSSKSAEKSSKGTDTATKDSNETPAKPATESKKSEGATAKNAAD